MLITDMLERPSGPLGFDLNQYRQTSSEPAWLEKIKTSYDKTGIKVCHTLKISLRLSRALELGFYHSLDLSSFRSLEISILEIFWMDFRGAKRRGRPEGAFNGSGGFKKSKQGLFFIPFYTYFPSILFFIFFHPSTSLCGQYFWSIQQVFCAWLGSSVVLWILV